MKRTTKAFARPNLALAAVAVVAGLLLGAPTASAQYIYNPFFDYTVAVGHAHAAEIIGIRLAALAAYDGDDLDGLLEQTEKVLTREFPRLAGSLRLVAPGLAADLYEALEGVLELAEEEEYDELPAAITRARQLARAAYAALVPVEVAERPEFVAAVAALLMLADDGVAEGFEDAVEAEDEDDIYEYSNGWAAFQRVKQLWANLRPLASEAQAAEIELALARIEELYPSVTPPDLQGADPEAVEDPGRQFVSTLEGVVQAYLYPERELGRVAATVADLVADGRAAYEAGLTELALERVLLAQFFYRENLRRLFDLIVPEAHAQITEAFEALAEDVEAAGVATFDRLLQALDEGRLLLGL